MDRPPLEALNRDALLLRIAALSKHLTAAALRALTEGREPAQLPDDELRHVIAAIEQTLSPVAN